MGRGGAHGVRRTRGDRRRWTCPPMPRSAAGKTLVEHTATNPNKAAHIGHLRNACIGDTVARVLRRVGHTVEVNNYIDDTGVQVADVVVGIRNLGLEPMPDEPFDQYCSRVYIAVSARYETDPALLEQRLAVLREVEEGGNETAVFVKDLARRIVNAHLATMRRFDIAYDLLTWESDIIASRLLAPGVRAARGVRRDRPRRERQARRVLGDAGRRRRGRGRRRHQGSGQVRRYRNLHGEGYRLPALEVRPPRARLQLRVLGGRPEPRDHRDRARSRTRRARTSVTPSVSSTSSTRARHIRSASCSARSAGCTTSTRRTTRST